MNLLISFDPCDFFFREKRFPLRIAIVHEMLKLIKVVRYINSRQRNTKKQYSLYEPLFPLEYMLRQGWGREGVVVPLVSEISRSTNRNVQSQIFTRDTTWLKKTIDDSGFSVTWLKWVLQTKNIFFYMFGFSFTNADNSEDSRGNDGDHPYCSLTVQRGHEHLNNHFQFYNWVMFLIISYVITRLLLSEICPVLEVINSGKFL